MNEHEQAVERYRASLDKHHHCPFCVHYWDSDVPDARATCPKCSSTGWERLCQIQRDGQREIPLATPEEARIAAQPIRGYPKDPS